MKKYMLKSDPTHPLKGAEFELFKISYNDSPTPPPADKRWVRDDENGRRWGFKHPISGEIVAIHPAGHGPVPTIGPISSAFTIRVLEVEVEEDEEVSAGKNLLTAKATVMGKPALRQNEEEE